MKKKTYEPVMADFIEQNIGVIPIIDVRPESYFVEGRIPQSINVPFDVIYAEEGDLDDNIVKAVDKIGLPKDKPLIVTCQTGYHSKLVSDALFDNGYEEVLYYPGSFEDWVLDENHAIEK